MHLITLNYMVKIAGPSDTFVILATWEAEIGRIVV
jgi:hypothetical protein